MHILSPSFLVFAFSADQSGRCLKKEKDNFLIFCHGGTEFNVLRHLIHVLLKALERTSAVPSFPFFLSLLRVIFLQYIKVMQLVPCLKNTRVWKMPYIIAKLYCDTVVVYLLEIDG